MTRDKHTVFPGATGGYADWYVATTRQLQTATRAFTHFRRLDTLPDGNVVYGIDIVEEHFPCLYWVSEIIDDATNKPCPLVEQKKYATEGCVDSPRVYTDEEAMFTVYQVTDVRFVGPPDIQTIRVSGTHMPQVREIQEWVLHCGQAPVGLDVLVKGATPVTVRFSAVLHTPAGTEIDFVALQSAVANHINRIPFEGVLAGSGLIALLHAFVPAESFVSRPVLFASVWRTDTPQSLHVQDRLVLDQLPFGTNRTSVLYCDPADISFEHSFIEGRC